MKSSLALVAVAFAIVSFSTDVSAEANVKFPDRVCDVVEHGAKGTRVWPDTEAFQKAIDTCAKAGGGTVRVPRGEYLIGPIFLRSNINLELQEYSEVAFATDPALYAVNDGNKAYLTNVTWIGLINIADAQNVAITGKGLIDGQGAPWWERWRADRRAGKGGGTNRPRLIHAARSRDLLFEGVTLINSPSFHLVTKESENITIRGTTIRAPAHSPNTDAIDPIDSRNVLITGNTLDVGDDVVAIKSLRVVPEHPNAAVRNIRITNNTCLQGRGISIGSETIGGVTDVVIENNVITGAMYGIRIKTPRGRGGDVRNVVFRNTKMTNVATPFVFSGYYQGRPTDDKEVERVVAKGGFLLNHQIYPNDADPAQPYKANETPYVHDIRVEGLTATGADRVGVVVGLPERSFEKLYFANVNIEAETGLLIRHADVIASNMKLKVAQGKDVILQAGGALKR